MFPAAFDYHRAKDVDDAIALLGAHPEARLLAGGHSLIPMMKLRLAQPPAVVDIGRCAELRDIAPTGEGVRVGALATHAEIHASEAIQASAPLLAEAAGQIGDPQVRNKGTIGGNIAHADPASDLPAVLVALGATIRLKGPDGVRQVAAGDFFVGLLTTDVRAGEVLTAIDVPKSPKSAAYLKVEHPASGYAVVGAAAVVSMDGGKCAAASLCFNGVTATPLVADVSSLVGTAAGPDEIAAALAGLAADDPLGDIHASGEYRTELARVYGARALAAARDRA